LGVNVLFKMTLRQQLYGLCILFLFPILTLTWLLLSQALDAIDFSNKEREGVAYIRAISPVMAKVALNEPNNNLDPLTKASTHYDKSTKTWEASTKFRISVTSSTNRYYAMESGTELVRAVGDGSNLILDPDLDSYYLMDATVIQIPTLLNTVVKIDDAVVEGASDYEINRVYLRSAHQNLKKSIFQAISSNSSGYLSESILRDYANFSAAFDNFDTALNTLSEAQDGTPEKEAALTIAHNKAMDLVRHLHGGNMRFLSALDALIEQRVDRKWNTLFLSLLLSTFASVIAIWLALIISRRIADSVQKLSERIQTMARGDLKSPIPLQKNKDEIGQIARSLTTFRDQAEQNAQLSEALENEKQIARLSLEKMAFFDDLTGLPNRKFLSRRLLDETKGNGGHYSALIYLDLDGFKEVNDTMTHQAGDALLIEAGKRLSQMIGPNDIVSRLGGDEFAVFVHDAQERNSVIALSNAIIEDLCRPYKIFNSQQFITASAGISILQLESERDTIELIRQSDLSMYRAKANGKNCVIVFDSSFDDEAKYKKTIEIGLREALSKNEIDLFFQPQFDVKTRRIVGVEGLARWTSSIHGEISPTVFIPIAETTGLIYDLGLNVLRKAVEAAKRWPDIRISINLSVAQLRHQQLIPDVKKILDEMNAPIGKIELEITESVVMDNDPAIAARLLGLRHMGFELSIDDFGTGYSSLGYLAQHRFDRLKIDRGFVRAAAESQRGAALLESIARIGIALGMDVCAEGVETYDDVQSTTAAGCTMLQGFYFSPAVPVHELDVIMANNAPKSGFAGMITEESFPRQIVNG
jgi:diguanylate cyclase (GGDEF)-like protein